MKPPRDLSGTLTSKYMMKYPLADWLVAYDLNAIYCDPWRDYRSVIGEWNVPTMSNDNTHPATNETYYGAATRLLTAINAAVVGQIPDIEPFSDVENSGFSSVSNIGSTGLPAGGALFQTGTTGWTLVDPATPTNALANANVSLSTGSAAPFRGNELIIDFSAGITADTAVKRMFLVSNSTYKPAATDTLICSAALRATNLVNAQVTAYSYAPNGGWANKSLLDPRQKDFSREMFNTGLFVAGGAGAQEYDIVVQISRINTALPATGVVAISNCDMYNLTKLRTSQFGV